MFFKAIFCLFYVTIVLLPLECTWELALTREMATTKPLVALRAQVTNTFLVNFKSAYILAPGMPVVVQQLTRLLNIAFSSTNKQQKMSNFPPFDLMLCQSCVS